MALDAVCGNDSVKEFIRQTVSAGRVGHAYLITGDRGVGKRTVATAFAGEILGTDKPEAHPDYTVVTNERFEIETKSKSISVDTIRALHKDIYIKPYQNGKKVYMIPNAENMTAVAQNALLKCMEEPPEYCVLLLLAENINRLLPTVRSRGVRIRVLPLAQNQIAEELLRRGVPEAQVSALAAVSDGKLGKALELREREELMELRGELLRLFLDMPRGVRQCYDLVRCLRKNQKEKEFAAEVLLSASADVLHQKTDGAYHPVNADFAPQIADFCKKIPRKSAARFSEITIDHQYKVQQNVNYALAVLGMAEDYWEAIHD